MIILFYGPDARRSYAAVGEEWERTALRAGIPCFPLDLDPGVGGSRRCARSGCDDELAMFIGVRSLDPTNKCAQQRASGSPRSWRTAEEVERLRHDSFMASGADRRAGASGRISRQDPVFCARRALLTRKDLRLPSSPHHSPVSFEPVKKPRNLASEGSVRSLGSQKSSLIRFC